MDIDKLSEKQKNLFTERLDFYIETAKFNIENQSNSFSSIDTKIDILLASLGILLSIIFTILGLKDTFFDNFADLDSIFKISLIVVFIIYIILVIVNFYIGYLANKNRDFSIGRDTLRIRDLDGLGVSNMKIKKDIADGLEISYQKNAVKLADKIKHYKATQLLWLVNLALTIILSIIITVI